MSNSNDFFTEDLQQTKQFVMKELARTGNYAVVEPGKDAIDTIKVDAKVKEETEKLVAQYINNASFISDYENNPESNISILKKLSDNIDYSEILGLNNVVITIKK